MAIAYLRVSTCKQNVENQKNEIIRFAQKNGMTIEKWHKEIVSGKCDKKNRKLGNILNKMKKNDTLIVSELSRLSRTIFDSIDILNICLKKRINLYSVKENYSCTNDLASIILGIISSMFSGMERNLISLRTKEALSRKQQQGIILGRPKGSSKIWNMLLTKKEEIKILLEKRISKTKIAILMGVSRVTLYKFIAAM